MAARVDVPRWWRQLTPVQKRSKMHPTCKSAWGQIYSELPDRDAGDYRAIAKIWFGDDGTEQVECVFWHMLRRRPKTVRAFAGQWPRIEIDGRPQEKEVEPLSDDQIRLLSAFRSAGT